MSREYDLYLEQHKDSVREAFDWLRCNLPEVVICDKCHSADLEHQICFAHDASKIEQDEYVAYDRYFYGGNRSFECVQEFNYAWLRHIHRNPHHWQYWVLNNDDPKEGEIILDMPYNYIVEMICDWWSFSFAKGNLKEIFKWYEERSDYMKLSANTRHEVTVILAKINRKLEEIENETERAE